MNEAELKAIIRCIHKLWYSEWIGDHEAMIKMHEHMSALWNFVGIESTLCENNPDELTPEEVKCMMRKGNHE